jgi:hypothetical protein
MAEDISKKITIQVEAETEQLKQSIAEVNQTLDGLLQRQKQLAESGQLTGKAFQDMAAMIKQAQAAIESQTKAINDNAQAMASSKNTLAQSKSAVDDHTKAIGDNAKALTSAKTSLAQNKEAMAGLLEQYDAVSRAQGDNSKGAKTLDKQIGELGNTMDGQQKKIDDSRKVFDVHKATTDELKKSFDKLKNVSGDFGPSLKEAAEGFDSLKSGLDIVKTGFTSVGGAIKTTGFGLLVLVLQSVVDYLTKTKEGSAMLKGAISAVGKVVEIVHKAFASFGKIIIDAVTHPVESLKKLGQMIVENVINRFKAFSVILDGIIHLDFKKIGDGIIQGATGITHATDKIANGFKTLKKVAVSTFTEVTKAYEDGKKNAEKAAANIAKTGKGAKESGNQQIKAAKEVASAIIKSNEEQIASMNKLLQAQNELNELKIKGMKDGADKQIAELKLQHTEQSEQLDKAGNEIADRIKKLYDDIAKAKSANPKADTSGLQSQLNTEINLQQINSEKRIQIEQQTAAAIKKIKNQEVLEGDQKGIDNAKTPDTKLAADKKLITDKYQFEIEQAQGNAATILELQTQLNAQLKQLDDNAARQKADAKQAKQKQLDAEILKDATQIEGQVLSLITAGIKQQADAKVAALEKDKTAELSNTSLTSAQKLAIQQKYKQQEGQIKAKAFKEEQEASIAQAIINGALAVTKVSAQTGVLAAIEIGAVVAETAIQVAKIASQKPPAYAKGGLHYSSDGRGGLLPGYSRTDNTNAYLRSGEGIVVSEAMRVPWARNLVSAINVGFGGRDFSIANPGKGYAVGGIFTDGGDANRYYNAPVTDQKNLANSIAYQMINNFPPVYVDVKDVNNQQNILAQTINRVNL